ncbi:hypothetical protein TWF481_006958 [Arthrobotrys musiformis]|uniref:Uncharacterized protein n=1 Tax=Arthrobotrys musiformis TaxID=47236 RepID=A0AAV9WBX4_9PEZI
MNQRAPHQSDTPPSVRRDSKRTRLSDPSLATETHPPQRIQLIIPQPTTPPRKPWPTRITKKDVVSLEQRLHYLDRLVYDAGKTAIPQAQRRLDELRFGAGSLAKIHVTDSLRTSVTQEEYEKARDEEIKNEIHRDKHRKVSGASRRRSDPTMLLTIPEAKVLNSRRVSMGILGRGTEATDRASNGSLTSSTRDDTEMGGEMSS